MSRPLRVLLIEDSEDDALQIVRELERAGFAPSHERVDTQGAVERALAAGPWEAVISDFRMPGFSGIDALRLLRARDQDTPFIFVSGTIGEETAVEAMRAGAQDYVTKGSLRRLGPAVAREVREAAVRRARRRAELRLQRIVDAPMLGILFWDAGGRVTEANDAFLRMVGYTRAELETGVVDWRALTPPEHQAADDAALAEVAARGSCTPFVKEYLRRDGSRVPVLIGAARLEESMEGVAFVLDITERVALERSLRESEARFRATFERAPVGIAHVSLEGRFLWVNQQLCAMTGYPAGELLEMTYQDLTAPGEPERSEAARLAMLAGTRGSFSTEKRYRRKDGGEFWGHLVTTLVRTAGGEPHYFISVFEDISGRKADELRIRQAEERYRALFDRSRDAVYVADLEGRFLGANPAALTLLGYTAEEIGSLGFASLLPDEADLARAAQLLIELVSTGIQEKVAEFQLSRKDGARLWVEVMSSLVLQDGQPVAVQGIARDITERKAAEAALLASKETVQAIFDGAPLAIVGLDRAGVVTDWNRGAARMFGWPAEEAVGRYCPMVPEESLEEHTALMRRVMEQGPVTGQMVRERTRGGDQILVSLSAAPLRDGIMMFLEDVTERKSLEEQLLRAQRLESLGTLAGGIAHDLNNMLAPITMAVDLLRMNPGLSGDEELLQTIEASARRGGDMVRQVLSFARGAGGERQEVQIRYLLREVKKIVEDTFPKDIQVRASIPVELETVLGDSTQLHQVLLNLCVNARDAMPAGGVLTLSAANVHLDAAAAGLVSGVTPGPHLLVTVSDTGTGIPPEVLDRIFDPFFTTKAPGKGTGLGLSTSLSIVRSHGGGMQVETVRGRGSTFRVYLPAAGRSVARPTPVAPPVRPLGDGELVLVVDDEASVRELIRQTLEAYGYRVLLASDGGEAVATYTRVDIPPDLVITDMMMPAMGGLMTIRVLRDINPGVRIIGTSGLGGEVEAAAALEEGARRFLSKPFTADQLLIAIREVLDAG